MNLQAILNMRCVLALILPVCLLALISCASGTVRMPEPIPGEILALMQPQPSPDANLLVPCPALPQTNSGLIPDLLRNHLAAANMSNACAQKHQGLIDAEAERKRFEAERIDRATKALEKIHK